jgi:hypothetical protein
MMGLSQFDERWPRYEVKVLTDEYGTTPQVVWEGSLPARRLDWMVVSSNLAAPVEIVVQLGIGLIGQLGRYVVATTAGTDPAVPPLDLKAALVAVGVLDVVLTTGCDLFVGVAVALTPGDEVTVTCGGGEV